MNFSHLRTHPNICSVIGIYQSKTNGMYHLVTEWIDGGTLNDLLKSKNENWKTVEMVYDLVLDLVCGMDYIHVRFQKQKKK